MPVAMLGSLSAQFAVHPVHAFVVPVPGHEGHALAQLGEHRVQLAAARAHAQDHRLVALAHRRGEGEIVTLDIEALGVGEFPVAVDGVPLAGGEVAGVGLQLWVTPLVALPVWMARVVLRARVVRDLLDILIALVHVELVAATHAR